MGKTSVLDSAIAGSPGRRSLKQRVLNAGAWSLAGHAFGQIIRLGSNLILTRLLVPDMFGLMAIATVIMVGLELFSDLGLRPNIVQSRRGTDPAFLNTAWTIQIVRGVLLWVVALGIAGLIAVAANAGLAPKASVYADARLPQVIAVLSFTAVIYGFASTKTHEASRNLELKRVTVIGLAVQIATILSILLWLVFDRSIWALVAGNFAGALTSTLLSHMALTGTANRLKWDRSAAWEIFHFGKWIFLSSIIGFLVINGDRVLLGALVDGTALGVYVIAFTMANAVETVFGRIISGTSLPALSEIVRDRPTDLKKTYYRLHRVVAPFVYFCSGALIVSGHALIRLLYDHRYADAGWMLEILAAGLLTVPFQIANTCFLALGRPDITTWMNTVRLVALATALPFGFYLGGLAGAVWGIVTAQFLGLPVVLANLRRIGVLDLKRELLALTTVLAGAGFGWLITLALN